MLGVGDQLPETRSAGAASDVGPPGASVRGSWGARCVPGSERRGRSLCRGCGPLTGRPDLASAPPGSWERDARRTQEAAVPQEAAHDSSPLRFSVGAVTLRKC